MPAYDASRLNDADLDDLVAYLQIAASPIAGAEERRVAMTTVSVIAIAARALVSRQAVHGRGAGDAGSARQRRARAAAVADLFRHLRRQPLLAARSDQPHQRRSASRCSGCFRPACAARHETTPLVIDGVMYLTTPQNHAFAHRRAHRPPAVALRAHAAERDVALLRPAEPRLRRARRSCCSWARSTPTSWRSTRRPAACAGTSRPPTPTRATASPARRWW